MHPCTRTILVAALLLMPASGLRAQTAADPSGHWEGAIDIPGNSIQFELDLAKNGAGELMGVVTSRDAKGGLPLARIAVEGRSVTFYARSDQPFHGVLSPDARSISGDTTLSGYTLPFSMSRTGDARIEPPATGAPITRELEGTWNGALTVDGTALRLVLAMSNQPGGLSVGRMELVDEGGLIVPVVIAQSSSRVNVELRGVRGSYTGTLNGDGTELAGTWTNGSISVPLTFRRTVAEGK